MTKRGEFIARVILAASVVAVIVLTLSPNPGRGQRIELTPGFGSFADLDAAANVLLFLPLGALAPIAARAATVWRVLVASALLSCALETAQWFMEAGRAADVNDVIANVLGALAGYAVTAWLVRARSVGQGPRLTDP